MQLLAIDTPSRQCHWQPTPVHTIGCSRVEELATRVTLLMVTSRGRCRMRLPDTQAIRLAPQRSQAAGAPQSQSPSIPACCCWQKRPHTSLAAYLRLFQASKPMCLDMPALTEMLQSFSLKTHCSLWRLFSMIHGMSFASSNTY